LLRGHIVAALTIVIWSMTFVQTKILLEYLTPVEILIDRFVLAWGLFWLIAPRMVATSWREELHFMMLGASGIFGYYIFENLALESTTVVNVGLLVTTSPIFTALFLLISRPSSRVSILPTIVGFGLVLSGLGIMGYGHTSELGNGDILALFGAVSFGFYSILLGMVGRRFDVLIVTRKSFFWGIVFLLLYALYRGESFGVEHYGLTIVWSNLLFLALIASGLCFVMWRWAVKRIGAVKASNYIYLAPLLNALAAVWVLDEVITLQTIVAGAVMLAGLVVAQRYGA